MEGYKHFIGIGGIGMSGLAQLLLKKGDKVSGSDIKRSKLIMKLKTLGAKIYYGHSASYIPQYTQLVIYSSAIPSDNPELKEAKKRGIPLMKRAEFLAQIMNGKNCILVSGAHGKTTTTSLLAHVLFSSGFSPTVIIGGILKSLGSNTYLGKDEYLLAEADESDGAISNYEPKYSIITNLDHEHLDYYKSYANIIKTFKKFIQNTKYRTLVNGEDATLRKIITGLKKKYLLFGFKSNLDVYAKRIEFKGLSSKFECFYKGKFLEKFKIPLLGRHNILNSLAVIGLSLELGISISKLKKALISYPGTERRFQIKLKSTNYILIDDYAHHPTEIRATIEAAKSLPFKRLVVVFQPHRYSRMYYLLDKFSSCFSLVDHLIITDIYPAGEKPLPFINSQKLYEKIISQGRKNIFYLPKEKVLEHILKNIKKGDIILILGAGDITKLSDEISQRLKRNI